MALCLADSVNMTATFYVLHTDLSSHSMLEGYVDNDATDAFRRWVKNKLAGPTSGYWCVPGLGYFGGAAEALVAKVKVAEAAELTLLIRYLREEVLVARYEEDGATVSAAAAPSSMASQISGLQGVLASLCEAYEARAEELVKIETAEAARREADSTVEEEEAAFPTAAAGLESRERGSRRTRGKGAAARWNGGLGLTEDRFSLVSACTAAVYISF